MADIRARAPEVHSMCFADVPLRDRHFDDVRRSRLTLALATALVLASQGIAAASPSADDAVAYGNGQAYERLYQDHLVPATCGIALERPRCNADLRTIQSSRGAVDAADTAMQTWLASGDITAAPKDWNGMFVTDQAWVDRPESSWWYMAGVVSIAAGLPETRATSLYLLHVPDAFAAHAGATPADFRGLVRSGGTPFEQLKPLQAALLASAGVTPYPAPSFRAESKADAQLGVYMSTLEELIDNPFALSRPESRAFGQLVLARLQRVNDEYGVKVSFASVREALSGPIPDDPKQLDRIFRKPLARAVSLKWPEDRRNAFLLGVAVAQVAYNAAVLHDAQADADFRGEFAAMPPYPGISAAVRADVVAMLSLPNLYKGGTWPEINSAASKATLDIAADP